MLLVTRTFQWSSNLNVLFDFSNLNVLFDFSNLNDILLKNQISLRLEINLILLPSWY